MTEIQKKLIKFLAIPIIVIGCLIICVSLSKINLEDAVNNFGNDVKAYIEPTFDQLIHERIREHERRSGNIVIEYEKWFDLPKHIQQNDRDIIFQKAARIREEERCVWNIIVTGPAKFRIWIPEDSENHIYKVIIDGEEIKFNTGSEYQPWPYICINRAVPVVVFQPKMVLNMSVYPGSKSSKIYHFVIKKEKQQKGDK